jgi:exosortase/archaeosortase family protein
MGTSTAPEAAQSEQSAPAAPAARAASGAAARPAVRFAAIAAACLLVAYALLFFPHAPDSAITKALGSYLRLLARVVGAVLALAGEPISVDGDVVVGRFPLRIVLDCAALEAQALLVAFVMAFPAPLRARLWGVAAGVAALTLANLARIVLLYYVGVLRPQAFSLVHEEIMQIVLVLTAAGFFAGWLAWTRRRRQIP